MGMRVDNKEEDRRMEVGLALTLCGLRVAFWIPAIILGIIFEKPDTEMYGGCTGKGDADQCT